MSEIISLGARYHRTGAPEPVFRVLRIDPTHQPHSITLITDAGRQTFVTVGGDLLSDPQRWLPVKEA